MVIKNKDKKKEKKEPLSNKILQVLAERVKDLFDVGAVMFFEPKKFIGRYGFNLYRNDSYYMPKEFSNLKRSPYFKYQDKKFYVTEKGRIKIIKNILANKKENKKWDNLWRVIIFDIPEANRRERRFLRDELKWVGCKEVQKSVWITPFDVEKELLVLLELWKKDFSGDIRFLKVSEISGAKELKSRFFS